MAAGTQLGFGRFSCMSESDRLHILEKHVRELERILADLVMEKDVRELQCILAEIASPVIESDVVPTAKPRRRLKRRTRTSRKRPHS
jgi:hypothetical protein